MRTSRLVLAAVLMSLIALGFSGPVFAAGCTGAPGASALQQYCEAVPDADGSRQHTSTNSSTKSGVSSKTAAALASAGADGAKIEQLAGGAPAPTTSKTKTSTSKTSKPSPTGTVAVKGEQISGPSDPSSSALKAASKAVATGPTVGGGVVWGLLGVSVLGVLGAVFARRRGSDNGDPFDPPSDS